MCFIYTFDLGIKENDTCVSNSTNATKSQSITVYK